MCVCVCVFFFFVCKTLFLHSFFLARITGLGVFGWYSAKHVDGLSVHLGRPQLFADGPDDLQMLLYLRMYGIR